jgi:hypothetical protein
MSLWEYIKAEYAVLRGAPVSFVGLVVVSIASGVAIGHWHFSERLETKDGEIHRYRVALGIDEASQGALVELNNQELGLKAQSIVASLRELNREWIARANSIEEDAKSGKITQDEANKQKFQAMDDASRNFNENLASDALNVEAELRKRLSPAAMSQVVRVPAFVAGGSRVTFLGLMRGSRMSASFIPAFADEMEQMAKLLPSD